MSSAIMYPSSTTGKVITLTSTSVSVYTKISVTKFENGSVSVQLHEGNTSTAPDVFTFDAITTTKINDTVYTCTFTSTSACSYSIDNGVSWVSLAANTSSIAVNTAIIKF